jgi:putative acetyltransferase
MAKPRMRPGTREDAVQVAAVFGAARARMMYLPALHTAEEDRAFFAEQLARYDSVVALAGDAVVAFAIHGEGWLHHLYVGPEHQARGLGAQLLAWVKGRAPGGLQLWTFAPNDGARRFYERYGFAIAETTHGFGNEEKVPDVRYRWTGSQSHL